MSARRSRAAWLVSLSIGALLIAAIASVSTAQNRDARPFAWPNGARGAVSLSYDDAVPIHYQRVAPLLEDHDLRGTFYATVSSIFDPAPWKTVASAGHELGNHSIFHPCRRIPPENYPWLAEHYDLADYTPQRWRTELRVANTFLDLIDGGKPRTYGNTCTNLTIGRGDDEQPMDPILADLFVAGRGAITNRPVDPNGDIRFTRLGHYSGDGKTFEQLRREIEAARDRGGWIIYMIHGVGEGTHNLFIDDAEHRRLIEWLDEQRDTLWTAPVVDVATWLKNNRPGN